MEIIEPISVEKVGASSDHDTPITFDYESVDESTRCRLKKIADEIHSFQRTTVSAAIRIGTELVAIKDCLDHGQFLSWLQAEVRWSERTAQSFMRMARAFPKSEIVADLPITFVQKLAASSTPETIRDNVIRDLEAGREIDCKQIETQIKRSRPSRLLENDTRIVKAVQKVEAILKQLSPEDGDRILRLLGTPGVLDRLNDERRRSKPRTSKDPDVRQRSIRVDRGLAS